jgi:hypothetical protein
MTLSIPRLGVVSMASAALFSISLYSGAVAQVATLGDPDTDAEPTPAPVAEELEGQEAILEWAACMRENDIEMADPQFGVADGRFGGLRPGDEGMAFDPQSTEFQTAMEACGAYLEAMRPELDAEEAAERAEDQLEMARCMRDLGWDFPDPEPGSGFGPRMMDSGLDFGDPAFQEDIITCQTDLGIEGPGGPGGAPPA